MSHLVITGDLHQRSLRSRHSIVLEPRGMTETSVTGRYLELCNEAGFAPTLFVPGKVVVEEGEILRDLMARYRFELGAHTWDCYRTGRALYALGRLVGTINGPRRFQATDIDRTLASLRAPGTPVACWRNHAYRQDRNTLPLLAAAGIKIVSNRVAAGAAPRLVETPHGSVWDAAINCLPDHESLRHGGGTATAAEWARKVQEEVLANLRRGIPAIVLAHPACMEVEDGMRSFAGLLRSLKGTPSVTLGDLLCTEAPIPRPQAH